jgi:hypothetical protein
MKRFLLYDMASSLASRREETGKIASFLSSCFWIVCATAASRAFLRPRSLLPRACCCRARSLLGHLLFQRGSLLGRFLLQHGSLLWRLLLRHGSLLPCALAYCSGAARCCRALALLLRPSLLARVLAAAERAVSQFAGARKNPRATSLSPRPIACCFLLFLLFMKCFFFQFQNWTTVIPVQ